MTVKSKIEAKDPAHVLPFAPGASIDATDVQRAIEAVYTSLSADLAAHLSDTTDAHDASAISVADAGGLYAAANVEAALAEAMTAINANAAAIIVVSDALAAHLADTADAHDASAISYGGGTGLSATDVEGAIDELATEKANTADLGTAAFEDIGTSGATVPLLSTANTWTLGQTILAGLRVGFAGAALDDAVMVGDASFGLVFSTTVPLLNFDADDYIVFERASNLFGFVVGGTAMVYLSGSALVVNESGNNFDTRMEGDTNTHLFFLDASADCIGVNVSDPGHKVHVLGSVGSAPSNGVVHILALESSATAGVDVGPTLLFRGQTNNSTARYGFAALQGAKASATAANYEGYLSVYLQNSAGSTLLTNTFKFGHDLTQSFTAFSVVNSGASNAILFDNWSSDTGYNAIGLNGSTTGAAILGLIGGKSGDTNLYYMIPTGGVHTFRVNNSDVAQLSASGLAIVAGLRVGFTGTPADDQIKVGDGAFGLVYSATQPLIDFDANDYMVFDRSNNLFLWVVSSVGRFRIDTTSTARDTALMVYDVDNNTLERVTVGIADSGGAGFKLLRIPN
jgi:hypothetical protein